MVAVVIVLGVLARIKPPGRSLKNFSSRFATFFDKIYCFEVQYQPWPAIVGTYTEHGPLVHRPPLWTQAMDLFVDLVHGLPTWVGPPLIYEEEFLLEV